MGEGVGFKMDCSFSDCDASDLRKRAARGDVDAQYNLGIMYQIGRDVEQDFDESTRWYRKAAKRGHAEARREVEKLDRR
ncbi:MAG: sel1 repeat family protein [Nitrospinae bacterium]|nr:sel1 repeat family protein [Nitrospinota bacterium]